MKKNSAKMIARTAIVASLYAICTLIFAPISYGAIQFRISECLCVLAFFYPEAVVGLTVGCFISNLFGNGPLDVIFGTLATFSASVCSFAISKRIMKRSLLKFFVCAIFPIVINALVVPLTFLLMTDLGELYLISVLQVGIGQTVVILSLGLFVYLSIAKFTQNGKNSILGK